MVKGEIWWAYLPSPRGSEPAKKRPVLIIQRQFDGTKNFTTKAQKANKDKKEIIKNSSFLFPLCAFCALVVRIFKNSIVHRTHVIQGDDFNDSALNTVICAVITSNISLAKAPPNMLLETAHSHLQKTSVVNFSQIVTIDKSFMSQLVSMLPKQFIPCIDNALKTIFNIC